MNIDDLKDAWSKDEPSGMHLPMSTALLGKTSSAVIRVRKNMRSEFWATLVCYVIMIVPLIGLLKNAYLFNITSILLFTLLMLNTYYFLRFYVFYKSIGRYDLNMKDSIHKVAYELELNTELYKAYNVCTAPLAVLISFGVLFGLFGKQTSIFMEHVLTVNAPVSLWALLTAFAVILISFIITYLCINWHVRSSYGEYLSELKQVMHDLEVGD